MARDTWCASHPGRVRSEPNVVVVDLKEAEFDQFSDLPPNRLAGKADLVGDHEARN